MKNTVVLFFCLTVIVLLWNSYLYAFGGCDSECQKCHELKPSEAEELLKQLAPDVKVLGVKMAPAKGLWEVAIQSKGKKGITYIDFSKENVISGQIFRIKTRENLTRKSYIELNRIDFSQIPLENSLVMGNPDAPIKVVLFDDPD